jgi:hypothetical protein
MNMKKRLAIYGALAGVLLILLIGNYDDLKVDPPKPVPTPNENVKTIEHTHVEYLNYEQAENPPDSLEVEVIEDGVTYRGIVNLSGPGKRNSATQQVVFTYEGTLAQVDE